MTTEKTDVPNVIKALDRMMDDGIVVEARIIVPSLEIYLQYAESVGLTATAD